MVVVVTCYCYMHPTRMRIASSCRALRVRGARDEVRLARACERSAQRSAAVSRQHRLGWFSKGAHRNAGSKRTILQTGRKGD